MNLPQELIIVAILLAVVGTSAMLIWVERRVLGLWQDRYGPNRVWFLGLGQVVADMIKIFIKDDWMPPFADKLVFVLAPAIVMVTILLAFAVVPIAPGVGIAADWNIGLLFFLSMTSLAVYSGDARRLGQQQQVFAARRHARHRADHQLRSVHGPVAAWAW